MLNPRVSACLGLAICCAAVQAQTPPTAYTVTQNMGMNAPGATSTVYRNGSKALVVFNQPAQAGTPTSRSYTLYDMAAGASYSWNPDATPVACSAGRFSGDWGDPFALSGEVTEGLKKGDLKAAGTDTVAGVTAQVLTGSSAQETEKVWFDQKDNLVLRATYTPTGAAQMTLVDVSKVSFAAPPASLFALPAACAGAKPPPTPAELIADETGDDAANYVNAFNGPGATNSCNVVLRVVNAKTMTPLTRVQVAIDTTYDQNNPPHYVSGISDSGIETFSGGGIHEITSQVHDGMVNLGTTPAYFLLDVNMIWPNHGSTGALIYRQCFTPTTVLLDVVKDFQQPTQSSDFLWVKSGKYATPPAN
jgi:hypothetical protein